MAFQILRLENVSCSPPPLLLHTQALWELGKCPLIKNDSCKLEKVPIIAVECCKVSTEQCANIEIF